MLSHEAEEQMNLTKLSNHTGCEDRRCDLYMRQSLATYHEATAWNVDHERMLLKLLLLFGLTANKKNKNPALVKHILSNVHSACSGFTMVRIYILMLIVHLL